MVVIFLVITFVSDLYRKTCEMNNKIPKTARLAKALLHGEVITIMDGFKKFGITNAPREISRSVERKFGVVVSKDKVEFTHDCGLPGWYYRYRLNSTAENAQGIKRMNAYCDDFFPKKDIETPSYKTERLF